MHFFVGIGFNSLFPIDFWWKQWIRRSEFPSMNDPKNRCDYQKKNIEMYEILCILFRGRMNMSFLRTFYRR